MEKFRAYINGEFITTSEWLGIINPRTEAVAGQVPALTKNDIAAAFAAAATAFPAWRETALKSRVQHLKKLMALMLASKTRLAELMELEIAKPLDEGVKEVERTVEYISQTIEAWGKLAYTTLLAPREHKIAHLYRVPLGVVLAISPFNYPVNLAMSKIAPALLVGDTVVFKPATNGSLTGAYLTELIHASGFPPGVFNLVTGRGRDIGDTLTTNPHIKMISFTGSVDVGKHLAKLQSMTPLVLELGGNDVAYVRFDADLKRAAQEVARGAFNFAGQRCTAIKRLIVHSKVKAAFMPLLLAEVQKLRNNPLVSKSAADYVSTLIRDAEQRGDHFLLAGSRRGNEIPFHIVETDVRARAWQEEAFGPLLPVVYISDEKTLVPLINDTVFGLQNSLFTSDAAWAQRTALMLESGTVNINRASSRGPDIFPFSGVKDSGFGTQGITDALLSMTRVHNIVENDA